MQPRQEFSSFSHSQYYFIAAAVATAIAGIVHLYFVPPTLELFATRPLTFLLPLIFFLGSGIAQIFWILPMIRRWGKPWYYIGIAGNIAFIILYVITRLPGNPITGRGVGVNVLDLVCELAQVAYIAITVVILAKEGTVSSPIA
jgi:hypothetical protein